MAVLAERLIDAIGSSEFAPTNDELVTVCALIEQRMAEVGGPKVPPDAFQLRNAIVDL